MNEPEPTGTAPAVTATSLPPSADEELCKHCERRPRVTNLGLCARCHAKRGIWVLYFKTRKLSPEREDRLMILAERARRRLPLFEDD